MDEDRHHKVPRDHGCTEFNGGNNDDNNNSESDDDTPMKVEMSPTVPVVSDLMMAHQDIDQDDCSKNSSPSSSSSSPSRASINNGYISSLDISLLLNNNKNAADNCIGLPDGEKTEPKLPEDEEADLKQLERDKKSVYGHPLFPLLALLFEKCEIATRSIGSFESDPSLSSFNNEIEEFIRHQKSLGKPFFANEPEVDSLMIKAIQVFRIHLLELEKVSDLCKDFCHRYISCLRSKMRSDLLISGSTASDGGSSSADERQTNSLFGQGSGGILDFATDPNLFFSSTSSLSSSSSLSSTSSAYLSASPLANSPPPSPSPSVSSQKSLANTVTNPQVPTLFDTTLAAPECLIPAICPAPVPPITSKSSPPLPPLPVNFDTIFNPFLKTMSECLQQQQRQQQNSTPVVHDFRLMKDEIQSDDDNHHDDDGDDDQMMMVQDLSLKSNNNKNLTTTKATGKITKPTATTGRKPTATNKGKKSTNNSGGPTGNHSHSKRGVLPKQATSIMRSWLFQHIVHPYPTEDEKRAIAAETNLTLLQVNNWFINARRRILQPMLDSATNNIQNELIPTPSTTTTAGAELDLSIKVGKSGTGSSNNKKLKSHQNHHHHHHQMINNNRFWPQSLANIIQTNDSSSSKL